MKLIIINSLVTLGRGDGEDDKASTCNLSVFIGGGASFYFVLESFQLQMGFSFPFLRANDLRSSLLIIRARSFLLYCA